MGFVKIITPRMMKASWVMLIVFLVLAFFDFYSTHTNPFAKELEANVVYLATGSWMLIYFINIFAIWALLKAYNSPKYWIRYMALSAFTFLSVTRISVIISNLQIRQQVENGEITQAIAASVSDSVKASNYSYLILLYIYLPLLISMVIYGLFRLDHEVIEK